MFFKFILHLEGTCYLLPPTFLLFSFAFSFSLAVQSTRASSSGRWLRDRGRSLGASRRRSNFISVKCFAKSLVSTQKRTSSCPSIIGTTMQFNGYSFLSLLNEKRQVIVPYGVPACSHACSIRSCMCFLSWFPCRCFKAWIHKPSRHSATDRGGKRLWTWILNFYIDFISGI